MKKLFLLLLLCTPAFAQARKIDFTQKLIGFNGQPILGGDQKAPVALTLGDVAVEALETMLDGDRSAAAEVKFKRDELARKIIGKSDVVLLAEEVSLIKERIGAAFGPAVIGAAWPLIDPAVSVSK